MTPMVSVIIPTYNRRLEVQRAIRSVLRQTYEDYEVIVVDDGSIDGTARLLTGMSTIQYHAQPHSGRSKARNRGIECAKGKYVAFLDSDDEWLPDKLEVQIKLMEDSGCVLSHTSYQRLYDSGKTETVHSGRFQGQVYPYIVLRCTIATPTVVIRRDVLDTFRFSENMYAGEDVVLWIQIAKRFAVVGIDEPLSLIRVDRDSTAFNHKLQAKGILNIMQATILHDELSWTKKYGVVGLCYVVAGYNCAKYVLERLRCSL